MENGKLYDISRWCETARRAPTRNAGQKDTQQIIDETRKESQKRHYEGSPAQQKSERYYPSYFPVPGNATERRFGYYVEPAQKR